ncbi:Fic family protein [Candidatus Zixiibacteriota bacterium]
MNPFSHFTISEALLNNIARIDEFKGRWASIGRLAPEQLSSLRRIATIESVGSSTRIEGSKLTDDEVEALLGGIEIRLFQSRDEQEVAGYADVMELILESYREITLTENHIKQLHGMLLKHSKKDERHRGQYKKMPNSVGAFDEFGQRIGVIFETATPLETPLRMEELISWTNTALESGKHHPLLVIGYFVIQFLAIHPFQDGNGRLSRALTTLLLLRNGYEYVTYSSMERIIEHRKEEYYLALRRGQAPLGEDESQLHEWITFFITCLVQQIDGLDRKVTEQQVMAPLPALSSQILSIVRDHGRVTVREAVALTGANRNTVKSHIQKLVQLGLLSAHGRGRGTWYERSSRHLDIKQALARGEQEIQAGEGHSLDDVLKKANDLLQ